MLAELAAKAMYEEKAVQNPYLDLENERHLERNRAHPRGTEQSD